MRPEGNPLDLNHLPEDYTTRDGKQVFEDTSTSGQKKKKNKDESKKVYECRFCSLKFCKSQALGGHMNRHRQERETETLNKARQLVYSSDNPPPPPPLSHHLPHTHLGSYAAAGVMYQQPPPQVYPTRPLMFSGASPPQYPHHHNQSFLYNTTSAAAAAAAARMVSSGAGAGDYYMGHGHAVVSGSSPTNYSCIGAPVGVGVGVSVSIPIPGGRDGLEHQHQEDGLTSPY